MRGWFLHCALKKVRGRPFGSMIGLANFGGQKIYFRGKIIHFHFYVWNILTEVRKCMCRPGYLFSTFSVSEILLEKKLPAPFKIKWTSPIKDEKNMFFFIVLIMQHKGQSKNLTGIKRGPWNQQSIKLVELIFFLSCAFMYTNG